MVESVSPFGGGRSQSTRVVSNRDVGVTAAFLLVVLALVVPDSHTFVPAGFAAGAVLGPLSLVVARRVLEDEVTRVASTMVAVAAIAGLAAAGYLSVMVWLLVGVNVGTLALASVERIY